MFQIIEGAENNLPDEASQGAAEEILKLVSGLNERDILFILISGGGSALAPLPKPPLTLQDKVEIIGQLSRAGATIQELNTVRIHLSSMKGGQLLLNCGAESIALILSDIVGSPLDLIAGGPTVPTSSTPAHAKNVLLKYGISIDSQVFKLSVFCEPSENFYSVFLDISYSLKSFVSPRSHPFSKLPQVALLRIVKTT